MTQPYERQDRGDGGAYDLYLRQMDASMRQKVALTAAHLLCEGELADMGMGSGSGSHALAQLYPELQVIGVDVNPVMVARARQELVLPNLRFVAGDVAAPCFEPGTLEAILDSSVLHHVTSFNGYDREAAARAIAVQVEQLATDGILVVRD
ncbi:MAG: class I SAM-dependent methyltransferase, partial [Deltaproteobacteria bacterium]|nr:class I SAM-dependent methyltransferase [Deltaproteobacteria bacterium]